MVLEKAPHHSIILGLNSSLCKMKSTGRKWIQVSGLQRSLNNVILEVNTQAAKESENATQTP